MPLLPIRDFIRRMSWAPDEVGGSTRKRIEELRVGNPGVLVYLPEELQVSVGVVERLEDEPFPPSREVEALCAHKEEMRSLPLAEARARREDEVVFSDYGRGRCGVRSAEISRPPGKCADFTTSWHVRRIRVCASRWTNTRMPALHACATR